MDWSGAFRLGKARQVRHGTFRRVLVRYVQESFGLAGQARFVGVWCGAARTGSLRQAG